MSRFVKLTYCGRPSWYRADFIEWFGERLADPQMLNDTGGSWLRLTADQSEQSPTPLDQSPEQILALLDAVAAPGTAEATPPQLGPGSSEVMAAAGEAYNRIAGRWASTPGLHAAITAALRAMGLRP